MSTPTFYFRDWQTQNCLPTEQAHHALQVLRLRTNANIILVDGNGHIAEAQISKIIGTQVYFSILKQTFLQANHAPLALIISPVKHNDRLEWLVEKAGETGVSYIILVQTKRTEKCFYKKERLQKILISALKQSKQPYLPILHEMNFDQALVFAQQFKIRLIASLCEPPASIINEFYYPNCSVATMIGPEGDFTASEIGQAIHSGFKTVSLGNATLRTETAGLYACMVHYFINQKSI